MIKAAALLVSTVVICAAVQAAPRVETVHSDRRALEFIVHFSAPALEEFAFEGQAYSRVAMDGLFSGALPGQPELPTFGVNFAVPPGTQPQLQYEVMETSDIRGLSPRPMPEAEFAPGQGRPLQRMRFEPDAEIYAAGVWPAENVFLSEPVSWRYQTMQTARVWPVRARPASGRFTAAGSIRVRIDFVPDGSRSVGMVPAGPDHRGVQALSGSLMINGKEAVNWRRRPPRPLPRLKTAAGQGAVRVRFGGNGIARLSYSTLVDAGFPSGTAIGDVAVQERGFNHKQPEDPYSVRTVSRLIEDENANGVFDQGDFLTFYGEDFQTRYEPRVWVSRYTYFHAYWICREPGGGRDFGQLEAPEGPFTSVTNFRQRLRVERDLIYRDTQPQASGFFPVSSPLYWLDERAHINTFPLDVPDWDPQGTIKFWGAWLGTWDSPWYYNEHHVSLNVNDTEDVLSRVFFGKTFRQVEGDLLPSADLLEPQNNTITVVGEHADPGTGRIDGSGAIFDHVLVEYDRLLKAQNDELYFHSSANQGILSMAVTGFTHDDILVLRVTAPYHPIILESTVVPDGAGYRVEFTDEVNGGQHQYVALSLASREGLPPMRDLPPDLAGTGYIGPGSERDLIEAGRGSDYVIVTHPDLAAPIQRLADHRASLGHRPFMCSIIEIYDQFSGGIKDPEAIHRFLRTAFAVWEEPPLYLLLAADANEDYRSDNPQASPDWVPTMMHVAAVHNGGTYSLSGTDPYYGQRLEAGEDSLNVMPDMFVGRLPVNTAAEADIVIDKILLLETGDPAAPWRRRGLFLADDQYSTSLGGTNQYCYSLTEREFREAVEDICQGIESSPWLENFECVPFFMDAYLDTIPELDRHGGCPHGGSQVPTLTWVRNNFKTTFFNKASEGYILWAYDGHANLSQMTSEALIQHNPGRDLDQIDNLGKPYIFQGFACHLAEYEHAYKGGQGRAIPGKMMLEENAGAVALFGSTGFEWVNLNKACHVAATAPLFWDLPRDPDTGRPRRLFGETQFAGLINLVAERGSFNQQDFTGSLLASYHVLGDPALRIDFGGPSFTATLDDQPIEPGSSLTAGAFGDSLRFGVVVSDDVDVNSLAVFDGDRQLIGEEIAVTQADSIHAKEVAFASALRLDNYEVSVEAEDWRGNTSRLAFPVDLGWQVFADGNPLPPGTSPLVQPQPHITAVLRSPAPLESGDIQVLINGEPSSEAVLTGEPEGRVWNVDLGSDWEPGSHTIGAVLQKNEEMFSLENGFSTPSTELELTDAYFYPNPLTLTGAAAGEDTGVLIYHATNVPQTVEISIYSASGRRVLRDAGTTFAGPNYFAWNGVDALGDQVANGVYLIVLKMTGHNGEEFRHQERVVISR